MRRSAQFRCEGWPVWTAVAAAGRRVVVWLAEGLGVNARDVTIATENPRCLAISVPLLRRRTPFVSAHGPSPDIGEEQVRLWLSTFAEELAAAARGQHVVTLLDANTSFNEDAGIHCGSEASKENTAGTALKELALCILQTLGEFGPTWRTPPARGCQRHQGGTARDACAQWFRGPSCSHAHVSLRHEGRHDKATRSVNFERAAILTKEGQGAFREHLG